MIIIHLRIIKFYFILYLSLFSTKIERYIENVSHKILVMKHETYFDNIGLFFGQKRKHASKNKD